MLITAWPYHACIFTSPENIKGMTFENLYLICVEFSCVIKIFKYCSGQQWRYQYPHLHRQKFPRKKGTWIQPSKRRGCHIGVPSRIRWQRSRVHMYVLNAVRAAILEFQHYITFIPAEFARKNIKCVCISYHSSTLKHPYLFKCTHKKRVAVDELMRQGTRAPIQYKDDILPV